jgi:hypothetical protein
MHPPVNRLAAAAVLIAGSTGIVVVAERPSPKNPAGASSRGQIVEWLRALEPLPKVHYSWPIPPLLLDHPDDPRLYEYVRLTRAASVSGEWVTPSRFEAAVDVCRRVNARAPGREVTIAINYSPWHRRFDKSLPPTDEGPTHRAELDFLRERLSLLRGWLDEINQTHGAAVRIGALLFDSERFVTREGKGDADRRWNDAITAKYERCREIGEAIYPGVRIEWYGRGVRRSAASSGWSSPRWHTFDDNAHSFSCSLYRVPEIGYMRETFRRTVELAKRHGVDVVTPWVALASGYRRQADRFEEWDTDWDYDLIYSWQLGAELNGKWFADRPDRFAPWGAADIVVFYPPPFDPRTPAWGKHFVAYVRGANGVRSLPGDERSPIPPPSARQ